MVRLFALIALCVFLAACALHELDARGAPQTAARGASRLERFESEEEFLRYLHAAQIEAERRGSPPSEPTPLEPADAPTTPPAQSGEPAPFVPFPDAQVAIANTPKVGVDGGDIVRQIGRFLVVLQDGRLFSVDTGPQGAPGLALADRANAYREIEAHAWYDEMLVFQNRVVVTGYSFRNGGPTTEFTVFILSETGALTHESTYYLGSDDYYDPTTYLARLVDDKLILYTLHDLPLFARETPISWPFVHRLGAGADSRGELTKAGRLLGPRDVHRSVLSTFYPVMHTISVCSLGAAVAGDEPECASAAFIGPRDKQLHVSRSHAYLWLSSSRSNAEMCASQAPPVFSDAAPAALYQIPLAGGQPRALLVRGTPRNEFAVDTSDRDFRALLEWERAHCERSTELGTLKYFSVPLAAFKTGASPLARSYVDLPHPGILNFENRFTDSYLVYGGRISASSSPPPDAAPPQTARVMAVPFGNPRRAFVLQAPHNIVRIERAGANIVLTGYRTSEGLNLSLLDLGAAPRLAATTLLSGRYETEGRSHAFDSSMEADASGVLGFPTVAGVDETGRRVPEASDVSFLSLDAQGALSSIGSLDHGQNTHPSYQCEVSCIDWYGNSRPIFTNGRIFALTGVELIEGELVSGRIEERRRINLTTPAQ